MHVSWPKKLEGEHVFETLEELRIWLETKLFARYGKKSREEKNQGIIQSIKKRGHVGLTATAWHGFSVQTRKKGGKRLE